MFDRPKRELYFLKSLLLILVKLRKLGVDLPKHDDMPWDHLYLAQDIAYAHKMIELGGSTP